MSRAQRRFSRPKVMLRSALCAALLASAAATTAAQDAASVTPPPSVTLELIERLAASGFLKPEDAASMRARAEQETRAAVAELAAARVSAEEAARLALEAAQQVRAQLALLEGAGSSAPQLAGARLQAEQAAQRAELAATRTRASLAAVARYAEAGDAGAGPIADDTVRVTYVPEVVKEQLREEIRQQVMAQAYEEKWAAPRAYPDWLSRFKFSADVRGRYEGIYYPTGNDIQGSPANFNSVNTGSPFDLSNVATYLPLYNVDQDRQRMRLRVRLGVAGDLGDGFTAGLRLATGDSNSPVSPNQSLTGQFSKYSIWLDRGFLRYERGLGEGGTLAMFVGRFDNPFFATDLIWDDDLGLDGGAIKASKRFGRFSPFVTAGIFPIYNTDLNFASNRPDKFASTDKWLYGAQLGTSVQIAKDFKFTLAGALYQFGGVEGRLSTPYTPLTSSDAGDTDATRPSFAQKGNTYMPLRLIDNSTALNNYGANSQYQYFGLATPFREVAVTAKLDYDHFQPFQLSLMGEYVRNTEFDAAAIGGKAVNNFVDSKHVAETFYGGDTGWMVALKFGQLALQKRWDWNMTVGYRRLESDAVIDGFADSDFGGGGTNLKGYTLGANVALSPRVWFGLRWLSAEQVSGSTFKNDTLQFDLNGKF
ncbi:MAG: putative porin [Opitutaceae bacterium]|nr:putative porin [Opitutaceae bacterium]